LKSRILHTHLEVLTKLRRSTLPYAARPAKSARGMKEETTQKIIRFPETTIVVAVGKELSTHFYYYNSHCTNSTLD
jgi:hypothetical protein